MRTRVGLKRVIRVGQLTNVSLVLIEIGYRVRLSERDTSKESNKISSHANETFDKITNPNDGRIWRLATREMTDWLRGYLGDHSTTEIGQMSDKRLNKIGSQTTDMSRRYCLLLNYSRTDAIEDDNMTMVRDNINLDTGVNMKRILNRYCANERLKMRLKASTVTGETRRRTHLRTCVKSRRKNKLRHRKTSNNTQSYLNTLAAQSKETTSHIHKKGVTQQTGSNQNRTISIHA